MKIVTCICALFLFAANAHGQDTIILEKYVSNLKKVEVVIDKQSYSFLFDTGGGETFISPEIAKRLGRTPYGRQTSFRMHGEMVTYAKADSVLLRIGTTAIFHHTVGVWDIMSILPGEFPKIDGILSLKSFSDKIVTIDFPADRLILETKASFQRQRKGLELLQSRFASGLSGNELTIFLNIPQGSRQYWFLFDSGNLDDLLFSNHTALDWKLLKDSATKRQELNSVKIRLGKKLLEGKAAADSIIYDGALNYTLISQLRYVINFPLKQVWIF